MANSYRAENSKATLKNMLIEAVKKNKNIGSSTAVLASMDLKDNNEGGKDVILKTCNLGDSGYMIVRAL